MLQPVVTRSQRRVERKQLGLIVVLIIAVACVSFALGIMYGRRSAPSFEAVEVVAPPKLPAVANVTPPPPPVSEPATEKAEQLTFYDNLPKGNQAPLGSGINLPPESPKEETRAAAKEQASPAVVKEQAITASVPASPPPKAAPLPAPAADGAFVVQVASFRARPDADKMAARLKNYQMNTSIVSVDLGNKGVWYRVIAGPYKERNEADLAAALLKEKERLSVLVRHR